MSSLLSIVMADDHPLILLGLAAAIGQFPQQRVVAQAHDGRELLQVLLHTDCNVIVTDYNMGGEPAFDGMQLLARLRKKHPKRAIVVCTMVHNPALLRAMRQIGVSGIVSKDDGLVHVGHAVMAGARGVRYDSPRILADTGLGSNERTVTERLSLREREVLRPAAWACRTSPSSSDRASKPSARKKPWRCVSSGWCARRICFSTFATAV